MQYLNYDFTEIKDHEELFEHMFAEHGKFKIGFGSSKASSENPTDIQISFFTPGRVVNEVSYASGGPITNGGFVLVVSDHEDAKPGDAGVVGYVEVANGKPAPRISMFVNSENVDPMPPVVRDSTQPSPYVKPRTTWLKTNSKYFVHLYRTDMIASPPAMALETAAS